MEQAKLQALSNAIDKAGLTDTEHAAVAYSNEPKGVPAAELDAEQREMLRVLLGTYLDRAPASVSPLHRYNDGQPSTPCILPGPDRSRRDSLTTTGCKVPGC